MQHDGARRESFGNCRAWMSFPYTHGPIRDESTHFIAHVNPTSGGLGSFMRTLTG